VETGIKRRPPAVAAPSPVRRYRPVVRIVQAVSFVALATFALHVGLGLGGHGLDSFFNDWVYDGLIVVSAAGCLARALLVGHERAAWLALALGLVAWSGAEILSTVWINHLSNPPYPSVADPLYLAFYPAVYTALIVLFRGRMEHARAGLWLDGVIAALAVAVGGELFVFHTILAAEQGSVLAVATDLAYPLGDLVMLALVIGVFALTGWRPGRAWGLIGGALVAMGIADVVYAYQAAQGTYTEGTILDALWPAATLLVACAAWQPPQTVTIKLAGWRVLVLPSALAIAAIAALVYEALWHRDPVAVVLAALTLVAATARAALTFRENLRMLERTTRESLTDSLTGLPNRRKLLTDLDRAVTTAGSEPTALVLFDLDGFKRYNDSFGHPAGDALLSRVGGRLEAATAPYGSAYRLGGDEFAALLNSHDTRVAVAAALEALRDQGDAFEVTSSHGVALLGIEVVDSSTAMQLADQRLYSSKKSRRITPIRKQTSDVLMQVLLEREPDLREHTAGVADLALRLARRLGLSAEDIDETARAAELHDIGKMAVPDEILNKPARLTEEEFSFMRQHTIIGERMLAVAPALKGVARIVRSSHERWDGKGYPDGLVAEEIPLPARIVSVCDSFDAMISDRPYQTPRTREAAMLELQRCAGTQFDPAVVAAFAEVLAESTHGVAAAS
jgi:diguanylate cyclase (GGDEF)-like protein/putative nucleotidyltransferase with HDIG domain